MQRKSIIQGLLVNRRQPDPTSDILLHLDLLEKSIEILHVARETNGPVSCQWSQSNNKQAWVDLENVFTDIYRQLASYYRAKYRDLVVCNLSCTTLHFHSPVRPRYNLSLIHFSVPQGPY